MSLKVGKELAALRRMTVGELRSRYAEAFAAELGKPAWYTARGIATSSPTLAHVEPEVVS